MLSLYLQALFDRYIDANSLVTGMEKEEASVLKSKRVTPKMFAHSIKQKCIANPQRIVLPEVRASAHLQPTEAHSAASMLHTLLAMVQTPAPGQASMQGGGACC